MRKTTNPEQLQNIRHSLAHLLAAAVLKLWPDAKRAIGPAIEDGFYFDFEFSRPISEADLLKIEKKMRELLPTWSTFTRHELTAEEAKKEYPNNPYKHELIDEFSEGGKKKVSFYKSGNYWDLCRGGHVENMREVDPQAFLLDRIAGAYWRGSEKNPMLTRIYGLAFAAKEELDKYLLLREEAKKRDHREIGKHQKLFFFDDLVGKGLPMWLPAGTIIKDTIEQFAREMEHKAGYTRVSTPHLGKEELYKMSGHLPYYKDSMYPGMKMDDGTYYLKAMNCPHHHLIYKSELRSWRDLPLRLAEYGTVYRNELSGTLAGLLRVRMLSMNDAHIYCRKEQIESEFKAVMKLVLGYFKLFGLRDYWFRLSLWDPGHKEKYLDEPRNWEQTQDILRKVLKNLKVKFEEAKNEAAFYGPKVDIQYRTVGGREETMSTIQLDFAAKTRFGLSYADKNGQMNNEVFVIHRAPLSTHERFIAFLIEHYAGAFPVWVAPVQIKVLPISDKHFAYAKKVFAALLKENLRVELDGRSESIGKKIREAELQKIPYMLIVGDKEKAKNAVSVRARGEKDLGQLKLEKFISQVQKEIERKK
jgi:threonyl-tRNA synthetase